MDKIFRVKDNRYKKFDQEVYNSDALDKENYEDIIGKSKSNYSKKIEIKEKDDFER